MTFQGLIRDYFPKPVRYGDGIKFVEDRLEEINDEMYNDERLNWPDHCFGVLHKFCEDRWNGEEWIQKFKRGYPREYTMCCIVLSFCNETISPEDVVDFYLSTIPIFFDEDVKWSDDIRKILEKKVSDPSVLTEALWKLLSNNKDIFYQLCNYENFEKNFKKGLEEVIVNTFAHPYSRSSVGEESLEESPKPRKHPHIFRKYSWKGYKGLVLQFVIHGKVGYVFNSKTEKLVGISISYRSPFSAPTEENRMKFEKIVEKYDLFREKDSEEIEEKPTILIREYLSIMGTHRSNLYSVHYEDLYYVFNFKTKTLFSVGKTFESKYEAPNKEQRLTFVKLLRTYILVKA